MQTHNEKATVSSERHSNTKVSGLAVSVRRAVYKAVATTTLTTAGMCVYVAAISRSRDIASSWHRDRRCTSSSAGRHDGRLHLRSESTEEEKHLLHQSSAHQPLRQTQLHLLRQGPLYTADVSQKLCRLTLSRSLSVLATNFQVNLC